VELTSALTAATILADAAVTPTVSKMTYNVEWDVNSHSTINRRVLLNIVKLRSDGGLKFVSSARPYWMPDEADERDGGC